MAELRDLDVRQGETFSLVVRWETTPVVYKAITDITQTAPAVVTAVGHGLVTGWRVAVQSVRGMTQINTVGDTPKTSEYHPVTVVDADTVELQDVNAIGYKAYTGGGTLRFNTPSNLTGHTCRMVIRDRIGGTVLASTEAADAPLDTITTTIDTNAKTVLIEISATATAAFDWRKGVYEAEMVSGTGVVTVLLAGNVSVTREVATA